MENNTLSKKQQKRLARAAKKQAQMQNQKTGRAVKSTATWAITLLVIVGIVYGLVLLVRNSSTNELIGVDTDLSIESTDWTIGEAEAPVQLIEFSDFQCPACAAYHSVVKQVISEYPSDVLFAYRHYPLSQIHPHAELAGRAAEAAGIQGKFWEMHDKLFETQASWSARASVKDLFVEFASELGLDVTRFEADIDSDEVKDAVEGEALQARALNLPGTPSFIVNGVYVQNPPSIDAFRAIIEDAIANAGADTTTE
ncbi:MAG: thioredoxin domain-containing protein [Candidatus Paceibacterota bacterium]